MKKVHALFVTGRIDEDSYRRVINEHNAAVASSAKNGVITIYINSAGGDTHVGIGLYDLLASSPRYTHGIVLGRAESAAAILLQGCQRRSIGRSCKIMLHGSKVGFSNMKIIDAQATLNDYKRMDDLMIDIIAGRAKLSREEIARRMSNDAHFDAKAALENGLVDDIL